MKKTNAEIQRAYRKRQGDALKAKERIRWKERRKIVTVEQIEKERAQAKHRMRRMRQRQYMTNPYDNNNIPTMETTENVPYARPSAETRAVNK
jgi:hypothetical protein